MVDDPYTFGRIAAANALSDIYAMGGVPKTAMNIVAFPARSMDISVLRSVIEGGLAYHPGSRGGAGGRPYRG